jgi:hypothetical protein
VSTVIQDPYLDQLVASERLFAEYEQHKSLIVALDFDDTVFDFHKKGYTYDTVLDLVRRAQAQNFYIVLFTGTHPDQWDSAVEYLRERGITINHINQNPIPLPFGNHGKMYYNILLDDKAGLGQAVAILDSVLTRIEQLKEAV